MLEAVGAPLEGLATVEHVVGGDEDGELDGDGGLARAAAEPELGGRRWQPGWPRRPRQPTGTPL